MNSVAASANSRTDSADRIGPRSHERGYIRFWFALSALICGMAQLCLCLRANAAEDKQASEIRVAAAADLKFAMDELIAAFEKKNPPIQVKASYGSSGNFFAQLSNHAPFDLFFSADVRFPKQLREAGLIWPDSEFVYGIGRIVLWVPKHSPIDLERLGGKSLLEPSIRKIAVANPKHAPYGQAAVAALRSFQIYSSVETKLVFGENIAQTAQFVQSGSADAGIIALSLALAPALKGEGRYWEIPLEAYPKMEQGGVILKWTKQPGAAESFRAFVLSDEGRAVLKRYGFIEPHP